MRKFAKLLIPALLVIAVVISCTVMFASAEEPTVIYISNNGAADGTGTKDNPIGHSAVTATLTVKVGSTETTHAFENASFAEVQEFYKNCDPKATINGGSAVVKCNAFYKAFDLLKGKVGTIVIMDEIALANGDRTQNSSAAEFQMPLSTGSVTITSNYDGVDYRASGAKLVLDHSYFNSPGLELRAETTWKDLNIEYKYNTKYTQGGFEEGYSIYASGRNITIDEGVTVTSYDATSNKAGSRYPNIFAGKRYSAVSGDVVVTVKSGTWGGVFGAGHGMSASNHASVTGNVVINVMGGTINSVNGSGSSLSNRTFAVVNGNLAINITGGKVTTVVAASSAGVSGDVDVTIKNPAKVNTVAAFTGNGSANSVDLSYDKAAVAAIKVEGFTTIDPPYDPNAKRVIYVAANGTGDGSTPESPLGHAPDYVAGNGNNGGYQKNAMWLAANELKSTGGIICIVGEVAIAEASSRNGFSQAPGEFEWPKVSGEIIITSTNDGVDYAKTNGAKLVLDYTLSAAATLPFTSKTTIDNIDILYKYNAKKSNSWGTAFMLCANGNELTIGSNVNVSSYDVGYNCEGDVYPNVIGGHRYNKVTKAPKVTIKSGTWGTVIAGSWGMSSDKYGNVENDATLIIEGGKIEEVLGTGSTNQPYGTVTGKVTIEVLGGEVGRVTLCNSREYTGTGATVTLGKDAVVKFADYAVKDYKGNIETLKSNTNFVNDNSVVLGVEPPKEPFVLYVANVQRGNGSGSSPENAIGHDEDYYQARAKALSIIAANGGTNSGLQGDNLTAVNTVYKKNALYKAMAFKGNKMIKEGGIIVVCDILTIDTTDAMRKSLADFWSPTTGSETITITSKAPDGTDYRRNNAALILDTVDLGLCVEFGSPMVLDSLVIEHRYNSKNGKSIDNGAIIAARGKELRIGYDVYMLATDVNPDESARVEMFPSICGGHRYSNSKADCNVFVGSGNWAAVVGGDWGSTHTGNATISIDGSAKIGTVCGTIKPTASGAKNIFDGSVWIGLWGGEVDNVIVVAKPGMKWGDASIGLGGTKVNGKIRATHADYSGEEIQGWVFNYTDEQIDTEKVIGFDSPVPATGSYMGYVAVVAVVALAGAVLLISKRRRYIED